MTLNPYENGMIFSNQLKLVFQTEIFGLTTTCLKLNKDVSEFIVFSLNQILNILRIIVGPGYLNASTFV